MHNLSKEQLIAELSVMKDCHRQVFKELVEAQEEK